MTSSHRHTSTGTAVVAGDIDTRLAALDARVKTLEAAAAPPPVVSAMWKALDCGKWGVISEVKPIVDHVRLDTPPAATVNAYGLPVIADLSGPYNTAGVSALDPTTWTANAVALCKAAPAIVAVEVLNEPAGSWFWGANAANATNAAAYAKLLRAVRTAFAANGITAKVLASYDGGYSGSTAWGSLVAAQDATIWSVVDGVTMHPYGGTADRSASALGARSSVTAAHTATGLPVYVTEVGWPTAAGQPNTGDSFQWSEAEQVSNITSFITWARSTTYVAAVTIFNYRDYGTNAWYGITRTDGTHKPSFAALATA